MKSVVEAAVSNPMARAEGSKSADLRVAERNKAELLEEQLADSRKPAFEINNG
jgi:hypothetical protein